MHLFGRKFAALLVVQLVVVASAGAVVLTTTSIGEGSVNPAVGAHDYGWGTKVNLSATPAPGWTFDHWEGAVVSSSPNISFRMWGARRVTAVFRPLTNTPENQLARYVGEYDPSYTWSLYDSDVHFGWTKHTLILTSQNWRSTAEVDRPLWEHDLGIIEPWFSDPQCVMLINGGSNDPDPPQEVDDEFAAAAFIIGMKYAQLDQVPNQPLYFADEVNNARTEDEILAYSLDKAIVTGDYEWPVHLAMAKSVVRAMDAVQERLPGIDEFMLAGGSKRGWTTYLASAVDPRVKAMAPLSIDIGNLNENTRHHFEIYGFYTSAVQDYVDFDLFCRLDDPAGQDVATIVDPLTYFAAYAGMPKVLANSTGDQFFPPDSSRFYWDALPGPKALRYAPNTDHSQGQFEDAIPQIVTAADMMMDGEPLPVMNWTFNQDGSLTVTSDTAPTEALLWQAHNPNARDFRLETIGAAWTSSTLTDQGGNTYVGFVPEPSQGWSAFVVQLTFSNGLQLTSEVVVTPDTLPYAGQACQ